MLSTGSTNSIEDVAQASGSGLRWFQLNAVKDGDETRSFVSRAERAGYKALVVTVDTPTGGRRIANARNRFDVPSHLSLANFHDTRHQSAGLEKSSEVFQSITGLFDPSLTWECIDWLRGITKLPIILKGILTAEDAEEAVRHSVQGIIVSNHGGRQLDGVLASVSFKCRIYFLSL